MKANTTKLKDSIGHALSFIEKEQQTNGSFIALGVPKQNSPSRSTLPTTFATSCILLSLLPCSSPQSKAIKKKGISFLLQQRKNIGHGIIGQEILKNLQHTRILMILMIPV